MWIDAEASSTTNVATEYSNLFFTVDLLFRRFAPCYSAFESALFSAGHWIFGIPEIGTKMTLLSAREDFEERTLASFKTPLEKLAYLARTRDEAGQYRHWGLNKVYGERAAATAMAEAHSQVWIEVLRTPIQQLSREMETMDKTQREALVAELKRLRDLSRPADLRGGSVRHFNSVLLALESLCRSQAATHRAA